MIYIIIVREAWLMVKIPTDADILPPSDDHIFKAILTHPDAEAALISLVSAALERRVTAVRICNNELPVSDDDEKNERARLRSRRKAETDRYSDMATAELRGELKRAQEIAKKMRARGASVEDIAEDTGLTVDDILRLK
jgi:hypothetical protein